jgi:hypothetical protein
MRRFLTFFTPLALLAVLLAALLVLAMRLAPVSDIESRLRDEHLRNSIEGTWLNGPPPAAPVYPQSRDCGRGVWDEVDGTCRWWPGLPTCATDVGQEAIAASRKWFSDFEECEAVVPDGRGYKVTFSTKQWHATCLFIRPNELRNCNIVQLSPVPTCDEEGGGREGVNCRE